MKAGMKAGKGPRGLEDFVGRWRFRRRIEGRSGAPGRLFDGIARFSPVPGGLAYEESGEAWPERRATRLTWHAVADGAELRFADGSDFHHLDLTHPVATAWHESDGRRHELSYNFTRWPEWRTIWRLRDAASDTTMITDYRR